MQQYWFLGLICKRMKFERIQNLTLQFSQNLVEKIVITPYYIMANIVHLVPLFLSHIFPLLLVSRIYD